MIPSFRTTLLLASALLSACAIGPDYKRPEIAVPAAFKEAPKPFVGPVQPGSAAAQLRVAKPSDGASRGKWWEVFNDADLNKLEEQVAASNQTIAGAEAAFRQARALVTEARSAYFPLVSANGSASRNGSGARGGSTVIGTGTTTAVSTSGGGNISNNYSASLDASWVPDFWGSVRRQVESNKAGAQASAADLATATLSAQAELAIDYFSLRIADAQKRLLADTSQAYGKSLTITQNQYKAGIVSSADVLQAKVQLESAQAQLTDVGVQRAQFEHAIAVLIGKAPANFTLAEVKSVPNLPPLPDTLPSQLLQRRPDIAASERRVAAANALIGVAEAAYFPDITLSASGGYAGSEFARLFTLPNRFWSIGPSLIETLFDAGLRAAQTEAAIAAYDQTVANYRQTVLVSFQEVEDNLAALRIYASEAQVQQQAVKDAQASVTVFLNQYKAGTVSYLNVVTAQTAELNNELSALNVGKLRLNAAATLIEDIGGGWDAGGLAKPSVTQGEATPFSLLPPPVK